MNFFIAVFLTVLAVVSASTNPLGPYKISDTTVSGLSSGGYMAVQVHVAFSSFVNGSAIFAGGPFYCAEGNLVKAEYKCMKTYDGLPDIPLLVTFTRNEALLLHIDSPSNMKDDRVYLFSGADDSVVSPDVMHSLHTYYNNFIPASNIVANFNVAAEHCIPTLNFGEQCGTLGSPYIGKCNFDGAGAAFQALYDNLKPPTTAVATNFKEFSQEKYIPNFWQGTSLSDSGYIYVPTACANGETCHLHFAFHGCLQNQALIGDEWATKTNYNEWAEANNIIVVYPYAKKSTALPTNPNGCWDWWGYTNGDYGLKYGIQMEFFHNIYKAVTGK